MMCDALEANEWRGELLCSKWRQRVTAPMLLPVQPHFPDRVLLITVLTTFTATIVCGVVVGEDISVLQRRGELFFFSFLLLMTTRQVDGLH